LQQQNVMARCAESRHILAFIEDLPGRHREQQREVWSNWRHQARCFFLFATPAGAQVDWGWQAHQDAWQDRFQRQQEDNQRRQDQFNGYRNDQTDGDSDDNN
jgi:hypothetical protein